MHTGLPYEPLDHRGNPQCTDCHITNADFINWQFATYQPDCAGCHAGDYKQKKHEAAGGGKESVSENRDCAGSCHKKNSFHRISDSDWDR